MYNQSFHLIDQKMESEMIKFPIIEYHKHPAFEFDQSKIQVSTDIDNFLFKMGKELNPLFGYSDEKVKYTNNQIKKFLSKIDFEANNIINIIQSLKTKNDSHKIYDVIINSLNATKKRVREEANFRFRKIVNTKAELPVLRSVELLERYGLCNFRIDTDLLKKIKNILGEDLKLLVKNAIKHPEIRQNTTYYNGPKFQILKNLINKSIPDETVKLYYGSRMEITSIILEYSHEKSTWYKGCYDDLNIPTTSTVYFHTDRDFNGHKMVINLSDVGYEQGPFSYIPSSNRMQRNIFHFSYLKELDIFLNYFFKNTNTNTKHFYYRKGFGDPKLRHELFKIPPILLGHSHFGDDIIDIKDKEHLLRNEFKITSNKADAVLFDGHNGIHRGGLVDKGYREVLYISWGEKKTITGKVFSKISSWSF